MRNFLFIVAAIAATHAHADPYHYMQEFCFRVGAAGTVTSFTIPAKHGTQLGGSFPQDPTIRGYCRQYIQNVDALKCLGRHRMQNFDYRGEKMTGQWGVAYIRSALPVSEFIECHNEYPGAYLPPD
jgi:hypothetical protein